MNRTTPIGRLIAALSLSTLAVGQQPTVPKPTSETKPQELASESAVSLSARAVSKDGATELLFEWKGQDDASILVVGIDTGQEVIMQWAYNYPHEFFGIVLCRSIGKEGNASVKFVDSPTFSRWGGPPLLVSAYVVNKFSVHVHEDSGKKGGGRIVATKAIRPKDCDSAFQVIRKSSISMTRELPGVRAMEIKTTEREFVTSVVDQRAIDGLVILKIARGDDQAQP